MSLCVSWDKKGLFFETFCVSTKWMTPKRSVLVYFVNDCCIGFVQACQACET